MGEVFLGSEAVASGAVSPYKLRSRYVAIHRDVYVARDTEPTAVDRAHAAWLWSRRRGIVAGRSAAALHGAKWVDANRPAELLHDNRHPPATIRTWSDAIEADAVVDLAGARVTTPARTAVDIARRYPTGKAVAMIDALAGATRLNIVDVELLAERYRGRRGIRDARAALRLVDPGAESPKETWLRLLLVQAGFPAPQTQIPIYGDYGQLIAVPDMGWQDIKVAVDYDGEHHRIDRRRFNADIRRLEAITALGWIDVRVTAEDTPAGIIGRVTAARNSRSRIHEDGPRLRPPA